MPKEKNFCCVDDYSVIVPYRDMVKFVEIAKNYGEINSQLKEMEKRYEALQMMYREMMNKLEEINRLL